VSNNYCLLYNSNTLIPGGVSGSKFDEIPEGYFVCEIPSELGIEFLNGDKLLHNYLVLIEDGIVELVFKDQDLLDVRTRLQENIVRDLHYKLIFFDFLNIEFSVDNSKITFNFDIEKIPKRRQRSFFSSINETTNFFKIYITEKNDPSKLITKFEMDIYQLSKDKTLSIDYTGSNNISVWASRI